MEFVDFIEEEGGVNLPFYDPEPLTPPILQVLLLFLRSREGALCLSLSLCVCVCVCVLCVCVLCIVYV